MLFWENGRLCPPTCPPPTLVMLRNWKFLMVLLKYCVYFEVLPVGAHSRNRKNLWPRALRTASAMLPWAAGAKRAEGARGPACLRARWGL